MTLDEIFDSIVARTDARVTGKKGMGRCPAHDDQRESLYIEREPEKIRLYCHAGCAVADVARSLGYELKELFEKPASAKGRRALDPHNPHPQLGVPSKVWTYTNKDGAPVGAVCRYETPKGKEIRQYTFNGSKWSPKAMPVPRLLYGLDILHRRPDRKVLLTEGEKAADAARQIVGDRYVVMTWSGGANGTKNSDFSPLEGREIVFWPDADETGISCMRNLAKSWGGKIINPEGMPKGWDAADALEDGWDWLQFREWALPRIEEVEEEAVGALEASPLESEQATETSPFQLVEDLSREGMNLQLDSRGEMYPNLANCVELIGKHPKLVGHIWYDTFHQSIFRKSSDGPRKWVENDTLDLTRWMQINLQMPKLKHDTVQQAVRLVAQDRQQNELKEWIGSLAWDGVVRIADGASRGFGVQNSEYAQAAFGNFLISMIARVYRPGCKVDAMLILEGKQGLRKSSALEVLGGKWYRAVGESVQSKDFFLAIQGVWLVEIAELDSFGKSEATKVKNAITVAMDRFRAPYGRDVIDYPRQCVFAGSTNEHEYLRDMTGGRRFWPLRCKEIDIDWLKENREQLLAEAKHYFDEGVEWWHMPEEETAREQEMRREEHPWEQLIADYAENRSTIDINDLMHRILHLDPDRRDMRASKAVGQILRHLGFERRVTWVDGVSRRTWTRSK